MTRLLAPSQLLRHHGIPVTAQRLAVMRSVSENPHSTADIIREYAQTEIGAISQQSVYDTLSLLSEKGLVRRIQPSRSPALYEDRVNDNHHHLVCRSCGHTADVDCATGEQPCLTPHDKQGFTIDEAEVIYWGLCSNCLSQKENLNT